MCALFIYFFVSGVYRLVKYLAHEKEVEVNIFLCIHVIPNIMFLSPIEVYIINFITIMLEVEGQNNRFLRLSPLSSSPALRRLSPVSNAIWDKLMGYLIRSEVCVFGSLSFPHSFTETVLICQKRYLVRAFKTKAKKHWQNPYYHKGTFLSIIFRAATIKSLLNQHFGFVCGMWKANINGNSRLLWLIRLKTGFSALW